MSNEEYMDIRNIMDSRDRNANQLPGKQIHYIPEERADMVLALDERIQKIQKALPGIMLAAIIFFTFLAGRAI